MPHNDPVTGWVAARGAVTASRRLDDSTSLVLETVPTFKRIFCGAFFGMIRCEQLRDVVDTGNIAPRKVATIAVLVARGFNFAIPKEDLVSLGRRSRGRCLEVVLASNQGGWQGLESQRFDLLCRRALSCFAHCQSFRCSGRQTPWRNSVPEDRCLVRVY
jgi:hypothetical protein